MVAPITGSGSTEPADRSSQSAGDTTDAPRPHRPGTRRSSRQKLLFACVYAFYVFGLVWLGSKLYWKLRYDVPVTAAPDVQTVWTHYFPELMQSGVLEADLAPNDDSFDVLMLGASVLEQVSTQVEDQLRDQIGNRLRVFHLPKAAHTTRDSLLKHSLLNDKHFDLIVIYHGINDARMNCCPDEDFKDDYTHCRRYHSLKRRVAAGTLTFPDLLGDQFGGLIPLGQPEKEMREFGRTIKTERPFRQNLEEIVSQAQSNDQPVLLMTFANYIPENYTLDRFSRHELDYGGKGGLPAEVWGKAEHVKTAITSHNQIIRDLAKQYDNVLFLDMQEFLSGKPELFSDPCHLTRQGQNEFLEHLLPAIVAHYRQLASKESSD